MQTGNSQPGVILAGGHGCIRDRRNGRKVPKILESIAGRPMLLRMVELVREAGLVPVVVVSERFRERVEEVWKRTGVPAAQIVLQPDRLGALDAAERAFQLLPTSIDHALVIYADMPLWRVGTIRVLLERHRASGDAVATMVTVRLDGWHPVALRRYGRIFRDGERRICRIVEPSGADHALEGSHEVNPSLYVWGREFLLTHAGEVAPQERGDGHPPEKHIPPLVALAYAEGRRIAEHPLANPFEALGVNSREEFARASAILAERRRTSRSL